MNFKSVVAAVAGDAEDGAVLDAACALAARFSGQVRVIPVFADPAADLIYYGASLQTSPHVVARLADSEREIQQQIEQAARDAQKRHGLGAEGERSLILERRALQPALALAPASMLADLVLFGAGAAQSMTLGGLFAEILLSTRAPVLLVKQGALLDAPVAVAWDGSAQAARAARAALPLLAASPRVLIARNVDDKSKEADAGDIAKLDAYLRLHGINAIERRDLSGDNVATSLIDAARTEGCGLLVAGAYGRPRLFEMVLGGTTRALVRADGAPHVLLAH